MAPKKNVTSNTIQSVTLYKQTESFIVQYTYVAV